MDVREETPSPGPVTTGSVASAATSSAGMSLRRSARSKPAGISTANSTDPEASASSRLGLNCRVTLKNRVLRSAARMERPTSLDSCGKNGRRQIARRRIDRIAEHNELQERDRHHGGERDAAAPQLQQLLAQHGPDAPPEALGAGGGDGRHTLIPNCPGPQPSGR